MQLTVENVRTIFDDCLFREGEPTDKHVAAEGIMNNVGFHPDRLEAHRAEIKELLDQLPDQFKKSGGQGWSFLNACQTAAGVQWGEHINIEQLLLLGLATKQAEYLLPRKMWAIFPGGMPYFSVND